MSDENDLATDYQVQVQNRSTGAWAEEFARKMQPRVPAPMPGVETPTTPALSDGAPATSAGKGTAAGGATMAVIGDVLKGVTESAPAIGGGMIDAGRNTAQGVGSAWENLMTWLESNGVDMRGGQPGLITGESLQGLLPEPMRQPESTTGKFIREGSRFLTGFIPAARALRGLGVAGSVANPAAAGFISDFATSDPASKNLSASLAPLLESYPALQQPVQDYLATDPDNPGAINRLKQAVEGAGLGLATQGILLGIRALAKTKQAAPTLQQTQQQTYGAVAPDDFRLLGDISPDAPLVTVNKGEAAGLDRVNEITRQLSEVGTDNKGEAAARALEAAAKTTETGVPIDVVAKGLTGAADIATYQSGLARTLGKTANPTAKELGFQFNWARFGGPDDIDAVVGDMMKAFKGEINEARRGEITLKAQREMANNLGMEPADLLARQAGQAFNAEQIIASSDLFKASGQKLREVAAVASGANATPADLMAMRHMMTLHAAVQEKFLGASAEAGRALGAMREAYKGGGVEQARQLQMMIEAQGGAATTQELARKIMHLTQLGVTPAAMAAVARKGWLATTSDMVKEAYVLGFLWNPATHAVNAASNMGVAFQQIYERAAASKIGDLLGTAVDAKVVDGEALAMTYGAFSGLYDALRMATRAAMTGETGAALGKIDLPHQNAISAATISRELGHSPAAAQAYAETGIGRIVDFFGTATRVPGHAMGVGDEFFKSIGYRMELHAQSVRQAASEGLNGPDQFKRMAEIVNNPPEHIRIAAADAAAYSTFTNAPGEMVQSAMRFRNSGSLNPTFIAMPFLRTPANVLRYTFERTPLAPVMQSFRDDVASGGSRRDLALARMATGTALISIGFDLAKDGKITGAGPSDPGKREALERQGWKPYAVFIDGKYFTYNRVDPWGMLFGFSATVNEKMMGSENDPEDFDQWEEIVASGIAVASQNVIDKSWFSGISRLLTMIKGSEHGEGGVQRYVDNTAGSLLPFSSAFSTVKRIVDPTQREVNSPMDGITAKIAGLSSNLPPARNLWGQEKSPQGIYGRVFDAISPVAVSATIDSPIDQEIERLDASVRRVAKNSTFDGVSVSFREYPQIYDDYVKLAGNELKHPAWGLGAKDFLDAVVGGIHPMSDSYKIQSDGPDGGKAAFIKNTISEYRKLAQRQIMSEAPERYPEFAERIGAKQQEAAEKKLPVIPGSPKIELPRRPAPPPVMEKRSEAAPSYVTQINEAMSSSMNRMQQRSDESSSKISEKLSHLLERDDARSQEIAELRKLATSDREFIRDEKTGALSRYKQGGKEYDFKRDKNNRITGMTVGKG